MGLIGPSHDQEPAKKARLEAAAAPAKRANEGEALSGAAEPKRQRQQQHKTKHTVICSTQKSLPLAQHIPMQKNRDCLSRARVWCR